LEILIVVGVVVALAAAVVLTRVRRRSPKPKPARAARPRPGKPPGSETAPPVAPPEGRGLGARVRALLGREPEADAWAGLEELLVRADVGPAAAARLVARVRERFEPGADPAQLLVEEVAATFAGDPPFAPVAGRLSVVMVVGVNGSGKTTTIGKLAAMLAGQGRRVCLAASDTFRAAAGEQLEVWAGRAGADLVAQSRGADPGAVAFDAVQAARARGADVLIVDTAGRLHTREPLMEELRKVRRVLAKAGGDIDETLLVLDATTGQNGIAQARSFTEAVDVNGIALTKLDGSARGGIVVAVREELGIPVKLVGTGERLEDLRPFDPAGFARQLMSAEP
jgi:fused signal recognition particle receptor